MDKYMQRVIEEQDELVGKVLRLDNFIASTDKPVLRTGELDRLKTQRDIMQAYVTVLGARINAYKS